MAKPFVKPNSCVQCGNYNVIHSTAIIHPSAIIADDVKIGPYCLIGANVEIGSGTVLESHVVVKGHTKIGKNNRFFQFGSIGEDCQDKKYAGEDTYLTIGDNNVFRESVTVHRGTAPPFGCVPRCTSRP